MNEEKYIVIFAWGYDMQDKMNAMHRRGFKLLNIHADEKDSCGNGPTYTLVWERVEAATNGK